MPQLLVRALKPAVIASLRKAAAAQGVSVEEAHRRLLHSALLGDTPAPRCHFLDYLRSVPPGKEIRFPRAVDLPRKMDLS